ncbi:protein of unknown function [Shewanella benthica]|uniref:Uncharacterized protein n=1 Tax=Shewanella benthica TaxID=43661 RepID=A0A330LVL3_9GAMM|nr:protein of unknown function [Shewanella benthica]
MKKVRQLACYLSMQLTACSSLWGINESLPNLLPDINGLDR